MTCVSVQTKQTWKLGVQAQKGWVVVAEQTSMFIVSFALVGSDGFSLLPALDLTIVE